ncbi:hypothetical protein [Streptomyces ehimensis]|uniref:Zinc-finger domain-containing protein n=1 Tax=Streptomyces ehimensis TaxID=68195 RepID=A0ABV9BEW4_9ACTN
MTTPQHKHVDTCYACRKDRTYLAWIRAVLEDPESAPANWRREIGRAWPVDEVAHKEHLDRCLTCQAMVKEMRRCDRELERRAMEAAARVVWPNGHRLPPQAIARASRVSGWCE